MGNSLISGATLEPLKRFGEGSCDGKIRSCIAAYIDDSNISLIQPSLSSNICEHSILIVYSNSVEVWSTVSGDRRCRKKYPADVLTYSCFGKSSNMGPCIAVGGSDGSILIFTTDLATLRRTLRIPGSLSDRTYNESICAESESTQLELQNIRVGASVYPSYIQIINDDTMLCGDSSGRLHTFSLSTGLVKKVFQCNAADEISVGDVILVGAVIIPRINSQNVNSDSQELISFAGSGGLVAVYASEDANDLLLAVKTQRFLIYLGCATLHGERFLLTVHARCFACWIIAVDSASSQVVDFEDELMTKKIPSFPTTAAAYCDSSKLLFVGDAKGTVFIRELVYTSVGLRMRLIKKAAPQNDCYCVTSLWFDYESNTLLVGDSSGTVRTVQNIIANTHSASDACKNNAAFSSPTPQPLRPSENEWTHTPADALKTSSDARAPYNEESQNEDENETVGDVLDEYQDGDEVIRL